MSCELFGDSEFSDGRQGVRRGCYEGSFGFVQGVSLGGSWVVISRAI